MLNKWLRLLVIHPFLLAAFPAIASLQAVKTGILPEEAILPLMWSEVITAVVFAICYVCFRNAAKAGALCSGILVLSCCYGIFQFSLIKALQNMLGVQIDSGILLLIYCLLCTTLLIAVLRVLKKSNFPAATTGHDSLSSFNLALNLASAIFIVVNLLPVVAYELELNQNARRVIAEFRQALGPVKPNRAAAKPDVYYIILDGFANSSTLKRWGYDNHEFLDFLRGKGFYVVDKAASNYDRTQLSLSSSLNMQYLDLVPKRMGKRFEENNVQWRLLQDSCVSNLFQELGYKFINVSSGVFATDYIPNADVNIRCVWCNYFTLAVALLTPFSVTERYVPVLRDMYAQIRLCAGHCLPEILRISGPKFVLIHSDISYAPCMFDQYGNKREISYVNLLGEWGTPADYVSQLKFAESQAEKWITTILSYPGPRPIIILQSDHGPKYPLGSQREYFNERMRILNAYHFPGAGSRGLYETITPVNSFRLLFNNYFQTGLPLLPDRSYCAPVYNREYDWLDVTDQLEFAESP